MFIFVIVHSHNLVTQELHAISGAQICPYQQVEHQSMLVKLF